MVVFEKLEVENFRLLNLSEKPLVFRKGVNIIRGHNEAGKSTVLEAILYALFGEVMRGNRDSAINHNANIARVKLTFRIGDRLFEAYRVIKRGRGPTVRLIEIFPDGETKTLAETHKTMNNKIKQLIGNLNFKEILVTNVVAQKELERLVKEKSENREKIINALIGIESYTKAINSLGEKRRQLKKDVDAETKILTELKTRYDNYRDRVEDREKLKEELTDEISQYQKFSEEFKKVKPLYEILSEYKRAKERYDKIQAKIDSELLLRDKTQKAIDSLNSKISEKREKINQVETEIKQLKDKLNDINKKIEKYNGIEKDVKTLNKIKSVYDALKPLEQKINSEKTKIKSLQSEIDSLQESEAFVKAKPLQDQIVTLTEELNRIVMPKRATIPLALGIAFGLILFFINPLIGGVVLFGSLVGLGGLYFTTQNKKNKLQAQINILNIQLQQYQSTIAKYNAKKEQVTGIEQELERDLQEKEQQLKNFQNLISQLTRDYKISPEKSYTEVYNTLEKAIREDYDVFQSLSKEIDNLENEIRKNYDLKQTIQNDIVEFEEDLQNENKALSDINKRINQLRQELKSIIFPELPKDVSFSKEYYDQIEHQFNDLRQKLAVSESKINNFKKQIEQLDRFIEENKSIEQEYPNQVEKVNNLTFELSSVQLAIEKLREVSASIRKQFIPSVEENMSTIISYITNGKYKAVRLTEDYKIQVFDSKAGRFLERDIFSGGTQDQFLLAMRLAFIISLMPQTKGFYPKFLFLDEPFSSSDIQRRQNIVNLLSRLLSKTFEQVIIITHVDIPVPKGANQIYLRSGKLQTVS